MSTTTRLTAHTDACVLHRIEHYIMAKIAVHLADTGRLELLDVTLAHHLAFEAHARTVLASAGTDMQGLAWMHTEVCDLLKIANTYKLPIDGWRRMVNADARDFTRAQPPGASTISVPRP